MSLLHRSLFASFVAAIEPIALKTLEVAAAAASPATGALSTAVLEAADTSLHASGVLDALDTHPMVRQDVASPFPPTAAPPAPAPEVPPVSAPEKLAALAAPPVPVMDQNAGLKARVQAMQAQLAELLASMP